MNSAITTGKTTTTKNFSVHRSIRSAAAITMNRHAQAAARS